ncbi:C1 family peptidase [Methylobacterium sp. J-026]|uniref:C1 family peptidase n=1 Tax=Methylobacterium sp. J-026 TaxID=2836624 RepID=UPI001FBAF97D|nr:C1 family peptidase [Methylobacterium sp. J-026]MCJ2134043.1 C1 family peptidase [Methylobacterium sp. J-026]
MITVLCDLRNDLLPVRHQGRRQSCLAFATSTAHEHLGRHAEALSVEYLYFHAVARTAGANPDAGSTMDAAAAALNEEGQPFEAAWTYQPAQLYSPIWVPPPNVGVLHRAKMSIEAPEIDEICQALDAGSTTILGLVITDAFWAPDAAGIVPVRDPDIERGGHAVLAVGYGCDRAGARLVLIRNSWGDRWGLNGHAWLTEPYLIRQVHQTAILT